MNTFLALAAQASATLLKPKASPKPVQKTLPQLTSAVEQYSTQSSPKLGSRPRTLGQAVVEGERINARLLHYLDFKTWTPAVGALLIAGIDPPLDCNEIPDGGMGLDETPLCTSDLRFDKARHIFKEWHDWKEDSGKTMLEMEPIRFIVWCVEDGISTEWLHLFQELIDYTEINAVDLTASRLALLANR